MALLDTCPGRRTAGVEQQSCGAFHKALCDWAEKLPVCNTPRGAQSSAVIFSMIETAKANGLDPYRYLVYILTKAPVLAAAHEPDWAVGLLPENVSKACLALQN